MNRLSHCSILLVSHMVFEDFGAGRAHSGPGSKGDFSPENELEFYSEECKRPREVKQKAEIVSSHLPPNFFYTFRENFLSLIITKTQAHHCPGEKCAAVSHLQEACAPQYDMHNGDHLALAHLHPHFL